MGEGGVQVLVVEDNEKNLKLVRDLLRFRGLTATEARTGREAVASAASCPPDIVLLDIDLPDMPGTEVLTELRGLEGMASVPIVAVTAYAMKGDAERLLASGFDGYIAKPVDVRSFVDTVLAAASGSS